MSINYIDDFIFEVYIKQENIENVNLDCKLDLKKYLINLFNKIKKIHNIEISGYYLVDIYVDKYYGIVLYVEREDYEYYKHFKNEVDMNINIVNTDFLYEIKEVPFNLLCKVDVIFKDGKVCLKLKDKLKKQDMMNLLEFSKIIYN